VTFTAEATGYPAPTVTWQVRWFGSPWVTIPGAKSTTLTFKATVVNLGTEYRAVFKNSAGTTATKPASLTLTLPSHPGPGHGPGKPGKP
jgi:endoglucanase